MAAVVEAYGRGLACGETGDWPGAVSAFETALGLCPDDRPSQLMLERARAAVAEVAVGS
jgi:hypothetical protein